MFVQLAVLTASDQPFNDTIPWPEEEETQRTENLSSRSRR
jgi:hypothetical protein